MLPPPHLFEIFEKSLFATVAKVNYGTFVITKVSFNPYISIDVPMQAISIAQRMFGIDVVVVT